MGAHRTGVLLNQDCAATPRGALEPCVQETVALLTRGPVYPWTSVCSEEEQENTGTSGLGNLSSEDVQVYGGELRGRAGVAAGCTEERAQPLAYLPQEDWAPMYPTRPAPPDSEGRSSRSDYCGVLDCYGECHPSTFPRIMQSSVPIPTLARGLSREHEGLETQPGGAWMLAGHCQRHGLHEDLQGTLLTPAFNKPRSWTL
ncbi:Interleukin-9 receptor [Saguinus oedipus]|uniref:Interleukin-9 receptor n=1 Tax=Saguinus oedipus TaxID=9490 RepID=A0ABQ9T9F5_SAGOE|nr:Interleukin-9 receptor [Saguinus oedipus]